MPCHTPAFHGNVRGGRHRVSLASAPVADDSLADALIAAVAAEAKSGAADGAAKAPR
jgi:hypothetical protein